MIACICDECGDLDAHHIDWSDRDLCASCEDEAARADELDFQADHDRGER